MSNYVARGQSSANRLRHLYGECAQKQEDLHQNYNSPTNHFPASVENKDVHCFTFIPQTGVFSTIKTDHANFVCLI